MYISIISFKSFTVEPSRWLVTWFPNPSHLSVWQVFLNYDDFSFVTYALVAVCPHLFSFPFSLIWKDQLDHNIIATQVLGLVAKVCEQLQSRDFSIKFSMILNPVIPSSKAFICPFILIWRTYLIGHLMSKENLILLFVSFYFAQKTESFTVDSFYFCSKQRYQT